MLESRDQGYQGEVFKWLAERQPIEILRFTGLRDNNGKEICEGDIIEGLGCYKNAFHIVKWDKKLAGFSPFIHTDEDGDQTTNPCHYQVIGNIYENPELIT